MIKCNVGETVCWYRLRTENVPIYMNPCGHYFGDVNTQMQVFSFGRTSIYLFFFFFFVIIISLHKSIDSVFYLFK